MGRSTSLALAFVFFFGGALLAEVEPAASKKPLGTWKRTAGDATLTFEFKTDSLHCILAAGGNTIEMDADYGMSKDGVLFGRISKVEKKGTNDGPSEGELFSFKVSVENETLRLSELKTHNDSADAKQLLEGEYQKQK